VKSGLGVLKFPELNDVVRLSPCVIAQTVQLLRSAHLVSQFFLVTVLEAAQTAVLATDIVAVDENSDVIMRSAVDQCDQGIYISTLRCGTFPYERGVELCTMLNESLQFLRKQVWQLRGENVTVLFPCPSHPKVAFKRLFSKNEEKEGSAEWLAYVKGKLGGHPVYGTIISDNYSLINPDGEWLFHLCTSNVDLHRRALSLIRHVFTLIGSCATLIAAVGISPVAEFFDVSRFEDLPEKLTPYRTAFSKSRTIGQNLAAVTGCREIVRVLFSDPVHMSTEDYVVEKLLLICMKRNLKSVKDGLAGLGFSLNVSLRLTGGTDFEFSNFSLKTAIRSCIMHGMGLCGCKFFGLLPTDGCRMPAAIVGGNDEIISGATGGCEYLKHSSKLVHAFSLLSLLKARLKTAGIDLENRYYYFHGTDWASALSISEDGIDPTFGATDKDFGKGFYVAQDFYLAVRWAIMRHFYQPALCIFLEPDDWLEDVPGVKRFHFADAEWGAFVRHCRTERPWRLIKEHQKLALVSGPIARDVDEDPYVPVVTSPNILDDRHQEQTCVKSVDLCDKLHSMLVLTVFFPENSVHSDFFD
jgi:hypothetical protein